MFKRSEKTYNFNTYLQTTVTEFSVGIPYNSPLIAQQRIVFVYGWLNGRKLQLLWPAFWVIDFLEETRMEECHHYCPVKKISGQKA